MKHLLPLLTFFLWVGGCASAPNDPSSAQNDPASGAPMPNEPILSGHSHNDYLHQRPLWEAISYAFASIEIDVHLVDGALLVGHDDDDLDATETLQSLYLDPLRDHVREHDGRVYPSPYSLILLIDIKSDASSTYEVLSGVLSQYPEMLTRYSETSVQPGAIDVIVSGNRPRELMMNEVPRFATYDGRLADLEVEVPANFISLISDNWENHFEWRGLGGLSDRDHRKLAQIVQATHGSGYRLRFWNTPSPENGSLENVWSQLLDAGVDLMNIDDLKAYRDFVCVRNLSGSRLAGCPTR
jgi:hypothetical protein